MQYAVFPHDFQIFPQNFLKMSSKYPNSKAYPDVPINQNYIICSSWCPVGSSLDFFSRRIWPDWGKYCMGRYGRIGVHRDIYVIKISLPSVRYFLFCTMCALPWNCHEMLYFYQQHAGSSLILVDCISLDEHYHISPVNICWLLLSIGARLDTNLVKT